jgi:hypothetical protein
LYSILLEATISAEMLGILPEDAFIEIIEGRISVDVVRNNPGPVIAAAVVGGPLRKSFQLACSVSSIVPGVATAAFPLVLEVAPEALVESAFETRRRPIVAHRPSPRRYVSEIRRL